jgi:integrase
VRRFIANYRAGPSETTTRGVLSRSARRLRIGADAENAKWDVMDADKLHTLIRLLREEQVSDSTIHKDCGLVRSFCADLRVEGYISERDWLAIKRVRLPARRQATSAADKAGRQMSLDEQRRLIGALGGTSPRMRRDKAVVLCTLISLRRAEITALKVRSIERVAGGCAQLRVAGKGGKERLVPCPPPVVAALDAWIAVRGYRPGALFVGISKGGKIGSTAVSTQSIYDWVVSAGERAGILHISPHDGRRTFISDGLEIASFGEAVWLQKVVGHTKMETTTSYDRRPDDGARQLVERIARRVHGNGS